MKVGMTMRKVTLGSMTVCWQKEQGGGEICYSVSQ